MFLSGVYPSANPKVVEGSLIGHKTWLSPSLSRLQRGDKNGVGIKGGVVQGGEGSRGCLDPLLPPRLL